MSNEQDNYKTLIEQTEATRFPPGVSGNPAGRPKNSVTTLLKNVDADTSKKIADTIIDKAIEGEYQYTREFLDRTDGRVEQDGGIVIDNRTINILVSSEKGKEQLGKLKGGRMPELEKIEAGE